MNKMDQNTTDASEIKEFQEPEDTTQGTHAQLGVLDIAEGATEGNLENNLQFKSSSVINFYPEWCRCFRFFQANAYRRNNVNTGYVDTCRSIFLCPPYGPPARVFTFIVQFVLGWIFLWLLLKDVYGLAGPYIHSPAHPQGPIFALAILEVAGLFMGILFKIIGLPSLLGPLLLGIILRNIEFLNLFKNLEGWNNQACGTQKFPDLCRARALQYSNTWIRPIRYFVGTVALFKYRYISIALILTRAGLGLSPKQLRKFKVVVLLLAFGPCIVEAITCAVALYSLFHPVLDITMCFVAGFSLATVSPEVVIPGILSLKKRHFGDRQAVPTLLMAASSIDVILALAAFTICLGFVARHGKGGNWQDFVGGFLGLLVGLAHGIIAGMLLHFLPARDLKQLATFRLILLLLLNITTILFYETESMRWLSGAGLVAVIVASFIASFGWRSESQWKKPMREIETHLAHLWILVVPLLFGTIGREMGFSNKGFTIHTVWRVVVVILISLIFRCTTAFFITKLAKLNWKEMLFCAVALIPKATIQAVLAPVIIHTIHEISPNSITTNERISMLAQGQIAVITVVLGIVITAPLGAILIAFLGPRLLQLSPGYFPSVADEEFPGGDETGPLKKNYRRTYSNDYDMNQIGSSLDSSLNEKAIFTDSFNADSPGATATASTVVSNISIKN